jgi:hypothetical protein
VIVPVGAVTTTEGGLKMTEMTAQGGVLTAHVAVCEPDERVYETPVRLLAENAPAL